MKDPTGGTCTAIRSRAAGLWYSLPSMLVTNQPVNQCSRDGTLPVSRLPSRELRENLLYHLESLRDRHGAIAAVDCGNRRVVFVFGPEYVHEVLSDTQRYYSHFVPVRGPRNSAQRRLSSGLLSMNGVEHRHHRRMLQVPFQRQALLSYFEPITSIVDAMLTTWREGETRDIKEEMTSLMLRVTSLILFGFDHQETALEIGRLLDQWMEFNQRCGTWAVAAGPDEPVEYEALLTSAEQVEAKIRELIRWRARTPLDGNDVLSILLRNCIEGAQLTEDQVIGHAGMLFGAAHLTTARTLTWTLLLLAQHPRILHEVWEESQTSVAVSPRGPEDLEQLPVLSRVVKESMRILPASAHSHRVNATPSRLGPFELGVGTPIVFSPFATHRMAELYFEPRRFLPERWKTIHPSPYEYFPFAAGPRMCLGGPLALMIVKIAIPRILARFGLQVEPNQEIDVRVAHTMLSPAGPILVRLRPPGREFPRTHVAGNLASVVCFSDDSWS